MFGVILTPENGKQFWIPFGLAEGRTALEDFSLIAYKTTNEYSKLHEGGTWWDKSEIGIIWSSGSLDLIISEQDQAQPMHSDAEINFMFSK